MSQNKKKNTAENEHLNDEHTSVENVVEDPIENSETFVESSESELALMQRKLDQMNDSQLRLQAEFDNYRKRTLKEKMELSKVAGQDIFIKLLPVMDDLERAMLSIDSAQDIESLTEGMHLIHSKFCDFTKSNGLQEIEAVGNFFDLDQHEAITKIPAPSDDLKGKVVDCVQKGYTLNGKVIRFSKVVIGE